MMFQNVEIEPLIFSLHRMSFLAQAIFFPLSFSYSCFLIYCDFCLSVREIQSFPGYVNKRGARFLFHINEISRNRVRNALRCYTRDRNLVSQKRKFHPIGFHITGKRLYFAILVKKQENRMYLTVEHSTGQKKLHFSFHVVCSAVHRLLELGEFADTLENVLLQLPVATRAVGVDMAILVRRNDDLVQ